MSMNDYVGPKDNFDFQEFADLMDQHQQDRETPSAEPTSMLGTALRKLVSTIAGLLIWLFISIPAKIISTVKDSVVVLAVSVLNTGGMFTIALYTWHMLTLHHSELFKLVRFTNEAYQSALIPGVVIPVLVVLLGIELCYLAKGFFAVLAQLDRQATKQRTPVFTSALLAAKLLIQYLIGYLVLFSVVLVGIKLLSHAYNDAVTTLAEVLVPAAQLLSLSALFWTGWSLFSWPATTNRFFSVIRAIFAIGLILLGAIMAAEYLCLYRNPQGVKAAPLFQDLFRVLLKAHYLPDIINERPIEPPSTPIPQVPQTVA